MIIELGDEAFTIDLHPRLTVFTALGDDARRGLAEEIIGALDGSRAGVHLELRDATGRQFALLRPCDGPGSVLDLASGEDLTAAFCDDDGTLDLRRGASLVVTRATGQRGDHPLVQRLAALDQRTLWAAAEAVSTTEADLAARTRDLGPAIAAGAAADAIEERHRALESAIARAEAAKRHALVAGGAGAVAAVPFAATQPGLALPALAITVLAMVRAELSRRAIETAERNEQLALAEVGAQSYLGFHIQRVDGMLSSVEARRQLAAVADAHRRSLAAWQDTAPGVDHREAVALRAAVTSAALAARDLDQLLADTPTLRPDDRAVVAEVLHQVIRASTAGPAADGLPVILDDPFLRLDDGALAVALAALDRRAGMPQVVLLSDDPRVAAWARARAVDGTVGLAEPAAPIVALAPVVAPAPAAAAATAGPARHHHDPFAHPPAPPVAVRGR